LAARYGGEEFALILPDTDMPGAIYIAEKTRKIIAELKIPHGYSKVDRHVTLSLGVAGRISFQDSLPEDLIKEADNALYQAKKQGRNCVFPGKLGV